MKKHIGLLLLIGVYLFFLANGMIHLTDPVESNYALTAKEMVLSGDYLSPQIYGQYWYDKPVFFYWQVASSFQVFGFNEFAARFWPAIFAIIGLVMTYFFGRKLYTPLVGLMTALILGTSFEYWYIGKAVITDMTLFVFFNSVLIFFYLAYSSQQKNYYYLCYLFAALATLTKGPIGFLLPGLIITLFLLWTRNFSEIKEMKILPGLALFCLVGAPWYYFMYLTHGSDFLLMFFGVHNALRATVAEHPESNVIYYYLMVLILGLIPWIFALPVAIKRFWPKEGWRKLSDKTVYLLIWAVTIFVFFQLIATKYCTYTFPMLLPVALLLGNYFAEKKSLFRKLIVGALVLNTVLILVVAMPLTQKHAAKEVGMALRNCYQSGMIVGSYGDYETSAVFYSGLKIYRLEEEKKIAKMKPAAFSWSSKNVMPFMSFEELAQKENVLVMMKSDRYAEFRKKASGQWKREKMVGNKFEIYRKIK